MPPARTKKPLFSIHFYFPSLSDELLTYIQGLLEECAGRRGKGKGEGMKYIIRKHNDRDVPVEAEPHCTYWTRRAEIRGLKTIFILRFGGYTSSTFTVLPFSNSLSPCPNSVYSPIVSSHMLPPVTQHPVLFTVLSLELCTRCCSTTCHVTHAISLLSRS